MIKMLDSGKEQIIIVNKGATRSLMFMQKLENRIIFFMMLSFCEISSQLHSQYSIYALCLMNIWSG